MFVILVVLLLLVGYLLFLNYISDFSIYDREERQGEVM